MEYHYTYLLTCNETQQLYFGARKSKIPPIEDKYWSSSKTVASMVKQGYTFTKTIDAIHESRQGATLREHEYHALHDVAHNDLYLNKFNQPLRGFDASDAGKIGGKASQVVLKNAGKGLYDREVKVKGGKIGGHLHSYNVWRCEHCNRDIRGNTYFRWHGKKCKEYYDNKF